MIELEIRRLRHDRTEIYTRAVASGVRAVVQALIIFPVAILLGVKFIANPSI